MKTKLSILLFCLSVLTLGCGQTSKIDRLPIKGLVVIEGKRIQSGSISFLPIEGTSGPSANTSIEDGQYQFTTDNGPVVGTHEVLITSAPADPKSVKMGEPGDQLPKEWKLEAKIVKGKATVNFEF